MNDTRTLRQDTGASNVINIVDVCLALGSLPDCQPPRNLQLEGIHRLVDLPNMRSDTSARVIAELTSWEVLSEFNGRWQHITAI